MTARLVAFVTILLALALAALAALVHHSQAAVMEEVVKTVSALGARAAEALDRAPREGAESSWVEREPGGGGGAGGPVVFRSGTKVTALFVGSPPIDLSTAEYAAIFSRLRDRSAAAFALVFVAGSALAGLAARRLLRPLRALDEGLARVAEGDLAARVPVAGPPEIARLGRGLNAMAERLALARDGEREAARREKLAALGRLAAGVAHDLRNPLHSIGLTLEDAAETCRPEDAARAAAFDRAVAIVRAEIRRLDERIAALLRFARSRAEERAGVDLRALADDVVRVARPLAERRSVRIDSSSAPEPGGAPPRVLGDGAALRAALLDVVVNAVESIPAGRSGAVAVRVEGAAIEVEDDGVGIDAADLPRVFEYAFSTKDGGHGLGLAMARQVVEEEHGGKIRVASERGRGTRVRIEFEAAS